MAWVRAVCGRMKSDYRYSNAVVYNNFPWCNPTDEQIRKIELDFVADEIVRNKFFLVTGTGKYFKNIEKDPETNLGLVKISKDGKEAGLIWGFKDGGKFTSEFPAHLMSHAARLKVNQKNRVIMHTKTISLTLKKS